MTSNTSPSARAAEQHLAQVRRNVAGALNSALREIDSHHYGAAPIKRMRHNIETCREAMRILMLPEPVRNGTRKKFDPMTYISVEELAGEK